MSSRETVCGAHAFLRPYRPREKVPCFFSAMNLFLLENALSLSSDERCLGVAFCAVTHSGALPSWPISLDGARLRLHFLFLYAPEPLARPRSPE
jgi:hypothetical protein